MGENEYTDAWSPEVEAANLAKRFEGVNQAAFARRVKFPGGASMINQHIKGRRPLNLQHAIAYAEGFGVNVSEISPRLAHQAADALRESSQPSQHHPRQRSGIGQAVEAIFEATTPKAAIERLAKHLVGHSQTRREIIGDLLQKLARDPENRELIEELAVQMDRPAQESAAA